ncbi:MAG: hypothetical protein ACI9TH_004889 [Kiritimatiellia bacterium]|jgi:hypothetical protein
MVPFRCINEVVNLAGDVYDPCFAVEMFRVSSALRPDFVACLLARRWDLVFLILMADCPEEVSVVWEHREDTLNRVFGFDHFPTHEEVRVYLGRELG